MSALRLLLAVAALSLVFSVASAFPAFEEEDDSFDLDDLQQDGLDWNENQDLEPFHPPTDGAAPHAPTVAAPVTETNEHAVHVDADSDAALAAAIAEDKNAPQARTAAAAKTALESALDDPITEKNPACPVDPKIWGGPGRYCHGLDLVYCSKPGHIADKVVRSCPAACVAYPGGLADRCLPLPRDDGEAAEDAPSEDVEEEDQNTTPFTATSAFMQCLGVSSASAASYAAALTASLAKFNIRDRQQIRVFLANCGVESAYWRTTTEYGNTLCKGYTGGCRYKGRGIIQITHDYTYKSAGTYFKQPYLANPEMVADMPHAFDTATWFWMVFKRVNRCFDGSRTPHCTAKCAAAYINGYFSSSSHTCSLRDPNHWAERQVEEVKVDRCMATHYPTTGALHGTSFNDRCGPTGTGRCGIAGNLPATAVWSGYCGNTPFRCIKPDAPKTAVRASALNAVCGPGGIDGYGKCGNTNTCDHGTWSGFCGATAFVCCKGK